MIKTKFVEFRCPWCGALICRYELYGNLTVEVKCYKCNGKFLYTTRNYSK